MWKVSALFGGLFVILGVIAYGLSQAKSESSPGDAALDTYDSGSQSWWQGAGSPMTNGLTVPEGANLVGPVFTTIAKSETGGWKVERQSAFLLASTGIEAIAQELADQASPPKLVPIFSSGLCVQNIAVEGYTEPEEYSGDVAADAVTLECGGYQRSGAGLEVNLRQDVTQAGSPVQGHLRWFSPADALPSSLPEVPDGVDGPSTVPSGVEGEPDLKIADGSFLAGPPGWVGGTGGFTAVIGVTGDPEEVFEEYVYRGVKPIEATIDGMHIRNAEWGGAGGVTYRVILNDLDESAWILVEAYND